MPELSFIRKLLLISVLWFGASVYGADQPQKPAPLRLTLHDSHGLSAVSAPGHVLSLILFGSHNHIHLCLSNISDSSLTIWQPHCPQGDYSFVVEFRDPLSPDKTYQASPRWAYTGGMGVPKVTKLAARDQLIVNLDFLGGMQWTFPIPIEKEATVELEVRVGYRSQGLSKKDLEWYKDSKLTEVWVGEVMGDWQKIWVKNATGKKVGP